MNEFSQGWKVDHNVEKEWHYDIMTKYGFEPITKVGVGWIRDYDYKKDDIIVKCTTGANSDRWKCGNEGGFWGTLESFLKQKIGQVK